MRRFISFVVFFSTLMILAACKKEEVKTLTAPVATEATNITSSSFFANFDHEGGNVRYRVQISTEMGFQGISQNVTTSEPKQVENMNSNTRYYYRVSAFSSEAMDSPFSNIIEVYTLPIAPKVIEPTNISNAGFRGNWESVEGVDTFMVTVSEGLRSYGPVFILPQYDGVETSDLFMDITGLNSNSDYYFLVKSKSGNRESWFSNYKLITTQ